VGRRVARRPLTDEDLGSAVLGSPEGRSRIAATSSGRRPGVFVNRVDELSSLATEASRSSRGEARVVHLSGPAGIGKTALAARFLADHAQLIPVQVAGAEAEAGIHLGLAEALLRALCAQAGMTAAPPADPLSCGAAVVELLGITQGHNGVVAVVVDDLQWADPASILALTFALRRLISDRVLTLLIGQDEIDPGTPLGRVIDGPQGRRLRLRGLDATAVRDMATGVGPHLLSLTQAGVLQAHTGGNPLHLQALLTELPSGSLAGAQSLPAPHAFAASALASLAHSPEPSRRLVAAAAVLGPEVRLADAARLAAISKPAEAAVAAPANLVRLNESPLGQTLRFTHPLNRAAVYHDLSPDERSRLHGLAAELTTGRPALWHRVRASCLPDPALAADLIRFSGAEADRGRFETAAEDLLGAAQVHPDATARQRLVLDAAELRLWGSDPAGAAALLNLVQDPSGSRWHYVHGHLATVAGRLAEGRADLQTAWDRIGPADDDLRGPVASWLALLAVFGGHGGTGAQWAERAVEALPPRHALVGITRAYQAIALWIAGQTEQAVATFSALPADPAAVLEKDAPQLSTRGQLRLWGDDAQGARADCARAEILGRRNGLPHYALVAAGYLAEAEYRLGEWDDAIVHSGLAVSLVEDTDQIWFRPFTHSIASLVWAVRGVWPVAETHVAAAREAAQALGTAPAWGYAADAAVQLAFARQDWPGVISAAAPLGHLDSRNGVFEPGVLRWREPFAEALIAVGRVPEARRGIQEALDLARERGRRSALARLARPRAALAVAEGHTDRARDALEEGIGHATASCGPFDQALLDDALGRLLRRRGERRRAASHLQAALERYQRLQATPFAGRCADELAACGLRPARRTPKVTGLTPREHAVVHLAARGLTNRQIAAELVISSKTVEYHLGSVFAKLGVTTRTQLAARLIEEQKT
jgi:DNA-binding NarL/FixJ family response regulator